MPSPRKANGTIPPCRFVSIDPTTAHGTDYNATSDFKVIEDIVVAQPILGVSQESSDWPPITDIHITNNGYAAIAGEDLKVYGVGEECLIELGGTLQVVHAGSMLKNNGTTDGKALSVDTVTNTATAQFYGGFALQHGVSGDKIKMLVQPGIFNYHA